MAGKLLLITTLAANIFSAFSAITFTSSNNVTVLVRFPAELRCQASIEDNIHIPLIRWYRNDGTPVESSLYNPIGGVLRFTSTKLSDAGWYLCNATSGHETSSRRLYLDVKDELGFLVQPPNVVVNRVGDTALLDCNTTNFNTQSSFVWTYDSNSVPLGSSPAVQLSGDNNERLIIRSVALHDIGNYTCRVTRTNTMQTISAVIVLSIPGCGAPVTGVGANPSLTISIIEIQPDGKKREELHCNIESCLTPTFVWTKDGAVVTAERTQSGVFVIPGTDIIVFTFANPSDSGLYNCTATNKLGSAWRAYRVTVDEEDDLIWTRWWMILIYCIIFCLFLFSIIILLIYVLCTGGLMKRKAAEDTIQIYDNTETFAVPVEFPPETGSQTWEQKFTGEEENQETGSQTWEQQFAADDDDDDDDDEKKETGSQT